MVVGTPGRLTELSLAGKLLMHPTGVLVLDEVSTLTMKQCGSKCTSSNSSAQAVPSQQQVHLYQVQCSSCASTLHALSRCLSPVTPVLLPAWIVQALGLHLLCRLCFSSGRHQGKVCDMLVHHPLQAHHPEKHLAP